MDQNNIPTRASLLSKLRNLDDHAVWQEFSDIYSNLILGMALRAGLSYAEAEDVVQETIIGMAKHLPDFHYDPRQGSFRSWLFGMVHWRCVDQFRNRLPSGPSAEALPAPAFSDADEAWWARGWDNAVARQAIERAKQRVASKKYQIFDLYVFKAWSAAKVARTLRISIGQVYLAKFLVANVLKKEVKALRILYGADSDRPLHDFPRQTLNPKTPSPT